MTKASCCPGHIRQSNITKLSKAFAPSSIGCVPFHIVTLQSNWQGILVIHSIKRLQNMHEDTNANSHILLVESDIP